jgi:hypothetical protein
LIATDIYPPDSESVMVTIEGNHFVVNPNNTLDSYRPDESTLIVRNQKKQVILYVRYMNKDTIRIAGVFNFPGFKTTYITQQGELYQVGSPRGGLQSNNCAINANVTIHQTEGVYF